MLDPLHAIIRITAEEALRKVRAAEPLRNYHILGHFNLAKLANELIYLPYQVLIEYCYVEHLSASGGIMLEDTVTLRHTHFAKADFIFAYFLKGLHIEGCTFEEYLDFQAGGHNKPGFPVRLLGNEFRDFVNFFDCIYEAEVIIEDNNFAEGTNLLGAPFNIPVTFEVPLQEARNTGNLHRNDEGEDPRPE